MSAPVLEAVAYDEYGCLKVWCEHCDAWHFHGPGDGHRVAHCADPASPYEGSGYILRQTLPA